MQKKTLDILLAVFNGEKYIRQQIESIMNQSYQDFHLWIRDNHSEDGTLKVIQECMLQHPQKITLLKSPVNAGIIGNFSALLEHAQADYILFSDADDVWLQEKISKTMEKMHALEICHGAHVPLLVHTDLKIVDAQLNTIHPSFWKYSHLRPSLPHTLPRQLIQNQITGCTVMINKALADLAQPIPKEALMHDWWLGLCIAAFGKLDIINEPTMLYRQHGKNDTGAKKYGFLPFFKRLLSRDRNELHQARVKNHQQATTFFTRYQDRLNQQQKNSIQGFLQYHHASFFKKGYLMVKWGIYRTGFLRNVLFFLLNIASRGVQVWRISK